MLPEQRTVLDGKTRQRLPGRDHDFKFAVCASRPAASCTNRARNQAKRSSALLLSGGRRRSRCCAAALLLLLVVVKMVAVPLKLTVLENDQHVPGQGER